MNMEPDRSSAKGGIVSREVSDPQLDDTLRAAKKEELELNKESNSHRLAMRKAEMGWIGAFIGSERHAAVHIAGVLAFFGVLVAGILYFQTAHDPTNAEMWSRNAERMIAFSATALAYIFGRGGKPSE